MRYQGLVLFLVAGRSAMRSPRQLQLLKSLFDDMARVAIFSRATGSAFMTLCSVLQVALWVYAATSAVEAVLSRDPASKSRRSRVAGVAPELPDWPLL